MSGIYIFIPKWEEGKCFFFLKHWHLNGHEAINEGLGKTNRQKDYKAEIEMLLSSSIAANYHPTLWFYWFTCAISNFNHHKPQTNTDRSPLSGCWVRRWGPATSTSGRCALSFWAGRPYLAGNAAPGHHFPAFALGTRTVESPRNCNTQGFSLRHAEARALSLDHGWNPGCRVRPGFREQLCCFYAVELSVQRGGWGAAFSGKSPSSEARNTEKMAWKETM